MLSLLGQDVIAPNFRICSSDRKNIIRKDNEMQPFYLNTQDSFISLNYNKSLQTAGGMFWIQIQSKNLNIQCTCIIDKQREGYPETRTRNSLMEKEFSPDLVFTKYEADRLCQNTTYISIKDSGLRVSLPL